MDSFSCVNRRPKFSSKTRSEPTIYPGKELESRFNTIIPLSLANIAAAPNRDITDYVSIPISFKNRVFNWSSSADQTFTKLSSPVPALSPDSPLLTTTSPNELSPVPATQSTASDGKHMVDMRCTSEIVEDDSFAHESHDRRISNASSRSTTLRDLFEAESTQKDIHSQIPCIDFEDHNLFSRSLSGFSNADSTAFSYKTTLGELLRSDADDHSSELVQRHRTKAFFFSRCKATIQRFQSKWKNSGKSLKNSKARASLTNSARTQQRNLPSPATTSDQSDIKQVIAKRWALRSNQRSVQSPAAAELIRSPSAFSRQLSSTSSVHEQYYLSRRTQSHRLRKRTSLPYREQLISLFGCIRP